MKYLKLLEKKSIVFINLFAIMQIAVLGFINYSLGFEISFSVFYLIPVAMAAWFAEARSAIAISLMSAVTWIAANQLAGEHFSHFLIPIWNSTTRLGFFLVVSILLTKLKNSLQHETKLAKTDFLTGAANPRAFYELLQMEMNRARRFNRTFSLMYFDADNFKHINDTLGHNTGSDLLVKIVETVKKNLRSTDIVSRLGGDEFSILFSETNQEQARIVVTKIRQKLLEEMHKENWAVTFSIGVLTCLKPPDDINQVLKLADSLMYDVKINGKNSVKFGEYPEDLLKSCLKTPKFALEAGLRK